MFDSFSLKRRPDQTVYKLNGIIDTLEEMETTVRVFSKDRKKVIIIGEQPINPATRKPYPFGIHTYNIKGDRLEKI